MKRKSIFKLILTLVLTVSLFWSQAFSVLAIKDVLQLKEVLKTEEKTEREETEIFKRNAVAYDLMKNALKHVGAPYVWGGESSDGFDCSGLVRAVFHETGLKLIEGYGMIPRETGFHGDTGNSWKNLVDGMEIGDEVTFYGSQKKLTYELAYKDCTYENDLPLPEGSIILNRGHIRLMLYQAETLLPESIHDYILDRYGIDCIGKTKENCDKIHIMNDANHNIDVEAYGNEAGDCDEGVIVCNNDMGVNGGDHYLVAALVPKADKKTLSVRVSGKETGTTITSGLLGIYKDPTCLELLAEKEVTSEVTTFTLPQDTYYIQHTFDGLCYLNDDDVFEVKLLGDREMEIQKEEASIRVDVMETEGVEFRIEEFSKKFGDYGFVAKVLFSEKGSSISNYIVRETGKVQKAKDALYYTNDNDGQFKLIGYKDRNKVFEEDLYVGARNKNAQIDVKLQEEEANKPLEEAFLSETLPQWDSALKEHETKAALLKNKVHSEKTITIMKGKWQSYHTLKEAAEAGNKPKEIQKEEKKKVEKQESNNLRFKKKVKYQK